MLQLFGEYNCKLDGKGRFLLPAALRKQFPEEEQSEFVINRGFERSLTLHSLSVWSGELAKISGMNQYDKDTREFTRMFLNGATKVKLDGNGRINLPNRLMEYAGIEKEVILLCKLDKVEIWEPKAYEAYVSRSEDDFSALASKVMGSKKDE